MYHNIEYIQVYGTQNLRVADISIMPLHINAHPQSQYFLKQVYNGLTANHPTLATAYVIGEKGTIVFPTKLSSCRVHLLLILPIQSRNFYQDGFGSMNRLA